MHVQYHHDNMSVSCIPPYTPLLYRKTGICRGVPYFLIFFPKHRLWVFVITVSHGGGSNMFMYPQSMF